MPDAATALQIMSGALNAPAPNLGGAGADTGVQQTQSPPAAASVGSADTDALGTKLAILNQASQNKFDYEPPKGEAPFSAGGTAKNYLAGFNETIYRALGAPVDLATHAINDIGGQGLRTYRSIRRAITGEPLAPEDQQLYPPQILDPAKQFGGSQNIMDIMSGLGDPRAIEPQNAYERAARAGGSATGQALGMVGGARLLAPRVPASAPVTGGVLRSVASAPLPTTAVSAAAGGAAGQTAEEAIPDEYAYLRPLVGFGTNLGVGGLTAAGIQGGKMLGGEALGFGQRAAMPFYSSGREQLAGQRISDAASNPGAVRATLGDLENGGELVPGSQPTTFQATGDFGLGKLERAQATKSPDQFLGRRAEQNAARVGAIEGLAPEGSQSGAVGDYLTNRLAAVDAQTQAIHDDAVRSAQEQALSLGGNLTNEQYGALLREHLGDAKATAKAFESSQWQKIDPNGALNIGAAPVADAANAITSDLPKLGKPLGGEEAAIFSTASGLPDVVPFREFAAFRGRVLDAIRAERPNGDTPTLRRLQMLRQTMDNTIAGASTAADATAAPSATTAAPVAGAVPGVGGNVYTPSGRNIGVRYEVVEGNSLVPSHTQDLRPNPAFPAELQPRERERVASGTQIANMAANLRPGQLGASADVGTGAPIVGPDGIVESGNARALAIQRAYQQGGASAKAYRGFLTQQGFNTEGMSNPVLIRRRITDLSPAERMRFAQEANASPGLAMSATERAAVDAGRMRAGVLDLYRGGDLGSDENRSFVRAFLKSVPDKGEEGALVTPQGSLSVDGARRIENALMARAYGNSGVVSALAETGDEDIAAFGKSLKAAAASVARLHDDVALGRVPQQFDMSEPLAQAADLVQRARASGVAFSRGGLANLVGQQDAFSSINPVAVDLLKAAYGPELAGRLNTNKFADLLRFVAEEGGKQSTEAQLFGNTVTPSGVIAAGAKRYGRAFETSAPSIAPNVAGAGGSAGPGIGAGGQEAPGYGVRPPGPGVAGTGETGVGSSVLETPRLTANFDAAAAQRYRAAADATRERAQTFGTGSVGQVLRKGPGGLPFSLSDGQVASRFLNSGPRALDNVQEYLRAVGDRPAAVAALQDAAASDLRNYAARADGTLDPAKVDRWIETHPAMRVFPELAEKFRDAASADRAIQAAASTRKAALDTYQKGLASNFLNGADPARAVEAALRSRDPIAGMRQLADLVSADPAARLGLQRATVELMQRRLISNDLAGDTALIKPAMFQNFVRNNRAALAQIFSREQLEAMQAISADLQRSNLSVTGSRLPGTPGTAQDLTAAHGGNPSMLRRLIIAEGLGALAEHLTGHIGRGYTLLASVVLPAFRDSGMHTVGDLVSEAMLKPDLARTLLAKVPQNNVRGMGSILAAQIRAIGSVAAARSMSPPAQNDQRSRMTLPPLAARSSPVPAGLLGPSPTVPTSGLLTGAR